MKGIRQKIKLLPVLGALLLAFPPRALALSPGDLLTPVGRAVAIDLETRGVLVAGLSAVDTDAGELCPAEGAGLCQGDRITAVNGLEIAGKEDFLSAAGTLSGAPVVLTAEREGQLRDFTVTPVRNREGDWVLGLWLREGVSGVGTVTFQDPESGLYGALGHGVALSENGGATPINGGSIASATVADVIAGSRGTPGELMGVPDESGLLGSVEENTEAGVFGHAVALSPAAAVPAAATEEIALGAATILSTVDESGPREFQVEITRILCSGDDLRQLSLNVTDPALLDITGGIVQGMSGSPILQNGKLIGAVTHVLVEDPRRGYGVTIQDMLSAAEADERQAA